MNPKTYFVVRVTTRFLDDTIPEAERTKAQFVSNDIYYGSGNAKSLRGFDQAAQYESASKARRALRYACVRDALERRTERDPLRRKNTLSFGRRTKQVRVETTAEIVKIVVSYAAEVVDVEPKRHALEHLAAQAG